MPFLQNITFDPSMTKQKRYPFNIPILGSGVKLHFASNVTFFVGENGSGKSTLLEGVADYCGFNLAGGNRNHRFDVNPRIQTLKSIMKLTWNTKVSNGFFMRAESFYNFASFIDQLAKDEPDFIDAYGGKSLHSQSHGESFFSLFTNRFSKGIYILDEPEAALSPQRQFAFMMLMHELEKSDTAQFLIATHSPILLTYPGASIYSVQPGMPLITYRESEHFIFAKDFLNSPEKYLRHFE